MADSEMADTEKEETMQAEGEGEAEEAVKTEEEIEQELKETQISISRYAPHTVPNWDLGGMRERWKWHVRVFPIDQEDCRNCILDTATKIAQESWYYVPKRKNGQGTAELSMVSDNEAMLVLARIVRMPFYHRYVTLELTKREQEKGDQSPFSKVAESASVVFDSTKCEKIKNTASSKGSFKRRNLWVRYVSEDTSKEMLHVLFPLSQSANIQTVDNLRIGVVETNSKTDVLIFMKSYLTVTINGQHVLALQNKEPSEDEGGEEDAKAELEGSVTAVEDLEVAPIEVADRSELKRNDRMNTSRILKRTLHHQHKAVENRKKDQPGRRGRGEPPAKRGGGWGDGRHDRRSGGRYGGGGGFGPGFGGRGGRGGFGPGGMMDPQGMAAEMMMMQAHLNQTIQNQLMMMGPNQGGGYGGGRYGGPGGDRGRRGGGRGGSGGRGGRKGFGGGW